MAQCVKTDLRSLEMSSAQEQGKHLKMSERTDRGTRTQTICIVHSDLILPPLSVCELSDVDFQTGQHLKMLFCLCSLKEV